MPCRCILAALCHFIPLVDAKWDEKIKDGIDPLGEEDGEEAWDDGDQTAYQAAQGAEEIVAVEVVLLGLFLCTCQRCAQAAAVDRTEHLAHQSKQITVATAAAGATHCRGNAVFGQKLKGRRGGGTEGIRKAGTAHRCV